MSARKWQPGDVAVVWINERKELAIVRPRQESGVRGALEFAYVNGGFDMVDDLAPGWSARPLVVIDPESSDVNRLIAALGTAHIGTCERVRTALRDYTTPPKPEEPTGLGAVVEDATGCRWTRWTTDPLDEGCWLADASSSADTPYADIAAVKVLSEGVTA